MMMGQRKPKKIKICPRCGAEHTKRRVYCSRSCGNVRQWTDQQRKNKSIANKKYFFETDEGEVKRWQMSIMRKTMLDTVEFDNPDFVEALESEDYVIPPYLDDEEPDSVWEVVEDWK